MSPLILVLFIAVYLIVHLWPNKKVGSQSGYFLANRQFGVFPLIATIIVSQYGWINGVFEVYIAKGAMAWLLLSLPYLLFNCVWIWLGKTLYRNNALTTPQLLQKHYGRRISVLCSLFFFILLLPVMYLHMGASILENIFNIPFYLGSLIFILLSAMAIFFGGFSKLVWTDVFLFFLVYLGLFAAFYYFSTKGFIGTKGINLVTSSLAIKDYFNWLLLALIVFIDPSIHQRIWASNNKKDVKKIMSLAVLGWVIFDFLIIGIVVFAQTIAPLQDVYAIAALLPKGFQALFIIMLLAVVLSTSNTYFNLSYNMVSHDLFNLKPSKDYLGRGIVLAVVMAVCYILTVFVFQQYSVVEILFNLNPVCISALFLPFISIFIAKYKLKPTQVLAQIIISALACLVVQFYPLKTLNFVSPVAIGLATSLIIQITFILSWQAQKETKN